MKPTRIAGILTLLTARTLFAADPAVVPPKHVPAERKTVEESIAVYVDVAPACPRPGCRAVTYEAIQRLKGVAAVYPKAEDSNLVRVRLSESRLPDPRAWKATFHQYVGTAGDFHGVVVELTGAVSEQDGSLILTAPGVDRLRLSVAGRSLQFAKKDAPSPAGTAKEERQPPPDAADVVAPLRATVGGTLRIDDAGYALDVRKLEVLRAE
jgi:hypothetical protein